MGHIRQSMKKTRTQSARQKATDGRQRAGMNGAAKLRFFCKMRKQTHRQIYRKTPPSHHPSAICIRRLRSPPCSEKAFADHREGLRSRTRRPSQNKTNALE
jgi:hypothetical protein